MLSTVGVRLHACLRIRMLAQIVGGLLAAVAVFGGTCARPTQAAPPAGYKLAWSDEFAGKPGTAPDQAKWAYDDGPVYNNEMEHYTSDTQHCAIVADPAATDKRALQITATDDPAGVYQSARLVTRGKYTFKYGYVEARIKLPSGQGMWPAFWMLGDGGTWPECGEVDIMENIGKEPSTNHGSIHGHGFTGTDFGSPYRLEGGAKLSDAYHTFGLLWKPGAMTFYVDGNAYETRTTADMHGSAVWPFDAEPFFFILNLAIGGDWPGSPDATTQFPQTLRVDYIRVYQQKN